MSERMQWFMREFTFDTPLWMFPNIIERLRGTPARVAERTAGLSPAILTETAGGGWSIQEHIGHLLDLEPLWLGRVDDIVGGIEVMRPADLTNATTDKADHNSRAVRKIFSAFRQSREALVMRLEASDQEQAGWSARHPRLDTPMRLIDLAFFVAEHDDHHLVSITDRLRRPHVSTALR